MFIHLIISQCLFCRNPTSHLLAQSLCSCAISRTVDPISDKVLFGELGQPSAVNGLKRRATVAQVDVQNIICDGGYCLNVYQSGRSRLNVT